MSMLTRDESSHEADRSWFPGDPQGSYATVPTQRYDATDQHVIVSVEDRVVTLSGTVTNWWHRYLARKWAWDAPGVEDVRDHLRIVD